MNQLLSKVPQGFKNFYPKGEENQSTDAAAGATKSKKTSDSADSNKNKSSGKKNSNNNNNSEDPQQFWRRSAMFVGFGVSMYTLQVLATKYLFTNETEISWQEFQSRFLESGQIDRIVVVNKSVARVILKAPSRESIIGGGDFYPSGDKYDAAATPNDFGTDPSKKDTDASKYQRYPRLDNAPTRNEYSPYYFTIGSVESFEKNLQEAQSRLGISPRDYIPVVYTTETSIFSDPSALISTAMTGLLVYTLYNAMRGAGGKGGGGIGNIFQIGKSMAKKIKKEHVNVAFKDVAGCDDAKKEIMEFVEFLKDSKKFTDLGAKIPKGALLTGPPGTGKTLLAKATAGEANVPFFSASGSEFVEMFVGVGASRVRDLFKEARASAPCIIFIDEIDAIGRKRGGGGMPGNDEREGTLNQLLVEMDGFDTSANIIVLAATNRSDVLDPALLRPGRFDRKIQVDKPDIKGRKSIFEIHLQGKTLAGSAEEYASRLASLTPGFAGAEISNICNEAAIFAARRDKKAIDLADFEAATDRVIAGLESKRIMTPEDKRIVAYHEAGHAVAGWFLEYADPLLKVTIVPRANGALGFAQYLPKEIFLRTRDQILDMVCMALAGRASEQINFGKVTTGASDDLRRVTEIVYQLVQVYGMNDKIGQLAFPKEQNQFGGSDRLYSEATAEIIDAEVRGIVDEAYARTLALMETKKKEVVLVAELLIANETISHNDVALAIGKRPFSAGKEYDEFVTGSQQAPLGQSGSEEAPKKVETPVVDEDTTIGGPIISPI